MTTAVIVRANHGWPVRVKSIDSKSDEACKEYVVPPGGEMTFHVWDGHDLLIHEIQPGEAPDGQPPGV